MAQFKLTFVMVMFELTFGVYINAYGYALVDIRMAKLQLTFVIVQFKFTFDCIQLPCLCLTDFGGCDTVLVQKMCVVCNNTLTLSLGTSSDLFVRLNHRRSFDGELVKRTLGVASTKMNTYKEVAEHLSTKNFTGESLTEYLQSVFPAMSTKAKDTKILSRPAQQAFQVLETQPGAEYGAGTFWQAFNAVTYTVDHLLGHSPDTRLQSAWYGSNRQRKVMALEKAVEMADAA